MISDIYLGIYVELFLVSAISLLLIFFVVFDYIFKYKFIMSLNILYVIILVFLLMLFLLNNTSEFFIFDFILIEDSFSIFIQNILFVNLILYVMICIDYVFIEKIVNYEYFLLLALSILGMITMLKTNDLISLYLALELQSLAFYILSSFKIYSNFSTEAGLKYFILGSFSSGLLLLGCSLIYGFSGTTNFLDLQLLFSQTEIPNNVFVGLLLGLVFITIGILFKLGVAPFHMWLPDVYDGVPTIVTALFAIIPKMVLFGLLYRLGNVFSSHEFFLWNQMYVYLSLLSIIIGTLGALYQVKVKKFLAYSAISHTGFLLIGYSSFNNFSLFATYVYILAYIVISLNIFTLVLSLRKYDNFLKFKKLNEFIVLFKSNPIIAINFCIILFSIAGIPPLLGFYSKFYVFLSAIKYNLYFVVFIAAFFSVIASMYYIRFIKLMFFKKIESWVFLFEINKFNSLLLSSTFLLNVIFCFYPQKFLTIIYQNLVYF
jgi:proton-translocating NADH-quinone oxidoreductase chain N